MRGPGGSRLGACTAPGLRIWWLRWWRPGHLEVAVMFLFLGLKHEKERAAFLGFFSSSASFFSFFFLSPSSDFFVCVVVFYLLRNRVLKTRFPGGRHVKNVPTQTRSKHENRPSKTRFIDPKSSLLDSRC